MKINLFWKYITIFAFVFFVAAGCNRPDTTTSLNKGQNSYKQKLQIANNFLWVEIADTPEKKQQGLSGRNSMEQNQGMLFEFDPPIKPTFWMKDMKFNLDLIWISKNKIVEITKNVPAPRPHTTLNNLLRYSPAQSVSQVLEVNGGWAEHSQIKIGDQVLLIGEN